MRVFSGQRAWLLQRVTAIAILLLLALGLITLVSADGSGYERWHALATSSHGAVLILLLFGAMAMHGWIGVRDIALDYIKPPAIRLPLLGLVGFILVAVMVRVLMILMGQS